MQILIKVMADPTNQLRVHFNAILSLLDKERADAVLIAHDDEYLSEELSDNCQRIKFLTGFSGSAGFCVIVRNFDKQAMKDGISISSKNGKELTITHNAAMFVDGRYTVQVKKQIDNELYDAFNVSDILPEDYLTAVLERGSKVAIDLSCLSYSQYQRIKAKLSRNDIAIIDTGRNLVDEIWNERPEPKNTKVEIFPDEYNGCPSPQKRHNLALKLRERDLDATVICDPESICWLLNIRGRDRHCLPVVNCRMVAYSNGALEWYISDDHLEPDTFKQLETHIGHIDIFPENRFDEVLERLGNSSSTVFVDPETVNAHVINVLENGGAKLTMGLGLCQLPKAIKNHVEIAGEYKAHIKDGIAMCRFFAWLDELTGLYENDLDEEAFHRNTKDTDEAVLADRAESFRKVEADYIEPSFDTISSIGTNGAMVHYNYKEAGCLKALGDGPLYMIDSGAHYLDGTTDITRTWLVGPGLTSEMRRMYTLVLKSHIALASLVFPKGTCGMQIDAIARRPLWNIGCDFAHGTGHGVGHLLSVHEGPQQISSHRSTIPLEPGMIVSDEPGYYKEGGFGIRIENLLVVQKCQRSGLTHMLCFSPLTLVPIDTRCLDLSLLNSEEKEWLNNYHQNVRSVITNAATTLSDTEISWLNQATSAI